MSREELKALGLSEEQIDAVMRSHGTVVNQTKSDLTAMTGDRDGLKTQLTDRDTQLEALKKIDPEALQAEIETLKAANATTATEYQGKLADQQKEFAVDNYIRDMKAKNIKAVRANLDLDIVSFKDGELSGMKEQADKLLESDAYLFKDAEGEAGSGNPNYSTGTHSKGSGSDGDNPFSKGSFNLTEQGRLLRDEPERFKQLKAQAK